MAFSFRPAVRENVPLIIVVAGGTGSGKTYTAMELATGMVEAVAPGKRFAVIDTENGRAKHYADRFQFDHGDLRAPFTPKAYEEATMAADAAGYPVIVTDSGSHEHAGEGGLLDWHEAELQRMAGDEWKKREACNMAAWIKPKGGHKSYVSKLLQVKAHLIICLRAEPKVEMKKNSEGKWEIKPKEALTGNVVGKEGWIPICEKSLPYEATVSLMFTADEPGSPKPIKLQAQHRPFFPLEKEVTRDAGRLLAEWAAGVKPAPISKEQAQQLRTECAAAGVTVDALVSAAKVPSLEALPAAKFDGALDY